MGYWGLKIIPSHSKKFKLIKDKMLHNIKNTIAQLIFTFLSFPINSLSGLKIKNNKATKLHILVEDPKTGTGNPIKKPNNMHHKNTVLNI